MDRHVVTGIVLLVLSLGTLIGLVLWSRRIIERIAKENLGHLRDFLRKSADER